MPLYDWKCIACEQVDEVFFKMDEKPQAIECEVCGGTMLQVVAIGAVMGDEAAWLQSVTEVVDRDGGQHCQEFIKDPTRSNYEKWMKKEGIRPLEPGEGGVNRKTAAQKAADRKERREEVFKKHHKRKAITLTTK